MIKRTHRLPSRDRWVLALVSTLATVYVLFQAFTGYNAALHEANIQFRNKKDGFSMEFFASMGNALERGQLLWLALNEKGDNISEPVFRNLCRDLTSKPHLWARIEMVLTTGPNAGHYDCSQEKSTPITPQDITIAKLTAQRRTQGTIVGPDRSPTASTEDNAHLESLNSVGSTDAQGTYTPLGYVRLVLRLQGVLDEAAKQVPPPGEFAIVIDNTATVEAIHYGTTMTRAPVLASKDWPHGTTSTESLVPGKTRPTWLTHWDGWQYTDMDNTPYSINLIQKSPVGQWLVWSTTWKVALSLLTVMACVLVAMTYALLKAQHRLRRSVALRTARLQRRARALQQAKVEHTYLQNALMHTAEREKTRLGHELHDGVGQSLTGARLLADSLALSLQPVPPALSALQQSLQTAIEEVRSSARNLTPAPLLEDGFTGALQALADTYQGSGVSVTVTAQKPQPALDAESALHLYRMAQEGITNAIRHGKAHAVQIRFGGDHWLSIQDNGSGFDVPNTKAGVGLRSQKLRAELLQRSVRWTSAPGQGAELVLL